MKKTYAFLIAAIAMLAANAASTACVWFLIDEPEMPNELSE